MAPPHRYLACGGGPRPSPRRRRRATVASRRRRSPRRLGGGGVRVFRQPVAPRGAQRPRRHLAARRPPAHRRDERLRNRVNDRPRSASATARAEPPRYAYAAGEVPTSRHCEEMEKLLSERSTCRPQQLLLDHEELKAVSLKYDEIRSAPAAGRVGRGDASPLGRRAPAQDGGGGPPPPSLHPQPRRGAGNGAAPALRLFRRQ